MDHNREPRRYSKELRFRVTPEQAEMIRKAAEQALARRGTGTFSDWVREVLVRAAKEEVAR